MNVTDSLVYGLEVTISSDRWAMIINPPSCKRHMRAQALKLQVRVQHAVIIEASWGTFLCPAGKSINDSR